MWHTLFIALHSVAGLIAFAAGCLAAWRRTHFAVYFWLLVGMVVFLVAALTLDWPNLDALSRILFSILTALGGYMVWRAVQASRLLPLQGNAEQTRFIHHVGFTLISLFVGFVVIAVLDLGAPGWLAALVGGGSVVVGRSAIGYVDAHAPPAAG